MWRSWFFTYFVDKLFLFIICYICIYFSAKCDEYNIYKFKALEETSIEIVSEKKYYTQYSLGRIWL